ncbi:tRNA lysidine(34) synthetase TilS [Rhodobacteraceae bacterium N5(2021)]|uniref:tRNA(Ile)-lysidine synthase n=1 Tax=Gymnodinialimonas phycosphaerae TaxID=2841589 RepID=A0A975TUJ6_9RHOB|nr:tRNA lysidine(34) synthetase TilS [Gymnodinialimonas phycosphaerae]MBY4895019.1 tRNA lysidine(34) synthetase TilS [Gymnodinialimonas phycosphaerae]
MGRLLGPDFPTRIALAVSGGGDSMAMLALAHDWARVFGVGLHVVTVDHGLRAESCEEATQVAEECAALGHPHTTLRWHWDGTGNLQDAARRARLRLIGDWRGDIAHVLFAHTQDDQAETLLMRLARGSGVEGLSAMAETRDMGGWQIVRPLLSETRAALRHYADVLRLPYVDDPSNEDTTYDRVRMRRAIAAVDLDVGTLAETATRMARAREALEARAGDVARVCIAEDVVQGAATGDLLIDRDAFAPVERDTQLRLLAAALRWVAQAPYRPRARALDGLLDRMLGGGGGTLHGAQVIVTPTHVRVCREFAAVRDLRVTLQHEAIWDSRWHICTDTPGLTLRALGPDGWQQLPARPGDGAPHDAAIARPALFDGARLVACAATTHGPKFKATLRAKPESFVASLLSR